MKRALQFPLRLWHRLASPILPPMCRFEPTCSVYAVEALDEHRLVPALWLVVRRLARCHPLHPGGYDPVPPGPEASPLASPKSPSAGSDPS